MAGHGWAAFAPTATHGHGIAAVAALAADPRDALARALAGLGQAIEEREAQQITGVHGLPRNPAPDSNHTGADRFAASQPPADDLEALKQWHLQRLLSNDSTG